MNFKFKVSVIIPTYNSESYIEEQLSAISQISIIDEILIVNNRCTDSTINIVRNFIQKDSRYVIIDALERPGVNYARNQGVKYAKSEYIVFLDSDDIVIPENFEKFLKVLYTSDIAGAAYIPYLWGKIQGTFKAGECVEQPPRLPDSKPYGIGAALGVRREMFHQIGGFDESYVGGHDEVDFTARAYAVGAKFSWCKEPLIYYRQRNTLKTMYKQYFHYGRTSVQLVLNFSPEFNSSLPGNKLLVRKVLSSFGALVRFWKPGREIRENVLGFAWSVGRLWGAFLYRTLKHLPPRQLMTSTTERD